MNQFAMAPSAAPRLEMKPNLGISDQVFDSIKATHGHADHSFEVLPLLKIVRSIINSSTQGSQVQDESTDEMFKSPNINLPFCTLMSISCQLTMGSCKLAGHEVNSDEEAKKTTLSIMSELSDYSWDAKAVLTMAAFAWGYGEFWHLALPHDKWDHLAKPLAILKGVDLVLKKPEYHQPKRGRRDIIMGHLTDLIKKTLDVTGLIYDLEKLSLEHNKEVPELANAILEYIPVAVYWAIRTALACVTYITIFLTKDLGDKPSGDLDRLISSVQMINNVFNDLTNYHANGNKQIELIKIQNSLSNLFNPNRFRINEVFEVMIFGKNMEKRIDIRKMTTVNVDELKGKKVVWFISSLDISDEYIYKVIIPIGETIIEQYQIVWIPIVYEWTNEAKEKFNQLADNKQWHVVRYFSTIAGIRFIEVDWQYKGKPMVVVTSHRGEIEYRNNSLPRDFSIWEIIIKLGAKWFDRLASYINDQILAWMKEKKHIFFYGGKDDKWVEKFKEKAETFTKDTDIKLVSLISSSKSAKKFWGSVEELFVSVSKINISHQQQVDHHVTQQVQNLFWFKNESGWAVLLEGFTVATSGHGSIMLKVLEDFNEKLKEQVGPNFGSAFKECQKLVVGKEKLHPCYRFDIEDGTEKDIPNHTMRCPDCSRLMKTYLSLRCCHEEED
ncbi:hypothetical protein FEM48_Zijuj07G0113600 [Ziziphus jujuba var. spinosa]|uniref:Protein SIEVE ELEMENT OCCLUSION B-like n=1 Tax=Ziziphus jujuba var. spinosa TaxID=714518 RepID=A0A978V4C2_ZIZJJ|nr:hypothetical protein FEM48_Zijuj07G0113600 [Ziziphus jujuba var. spinosa]